MFSRFGRFFNVNSRELLNNTLEEALTSIQNKDKEKLKSLFAKNALNKIENLDDSIEELFSYYEGEYTSYDDWGAFHETGEIKYGNKITELRSTYDIVTDKGNYRATMKMISVDTNDSGNIGVWSIYFIKAENDDDLSCAYWGDKKNTPGINLDIKNAPDAHIDINNI